MAQKGGGEWYQSINFNKLSCRQVSVFGPKGTPSREEHKTSGRVLTTFSVALTNWCRKIQQNVSRRSIQNIRAHSVDVPTV
jgi:hypothetical protein